MNDNDAKAFWELISAKIEKKFKEQSDIHSSIYACLAIVTDVDADGTVTARLLNSPSDGSQDFVVRNRSGSTLEVGDSVWLHYWSDYTNVYIAMRNSGSDVLALPYDSVSSNLLINGGFDVWQRGTSFSSPLSGTYTADRWRIDYNDTGATRTISRQTFVVGQTDVPNNPTYFLRYNQSVAGSGGTFNAIPQRVENVLLLSGKTVTLSFYARATSPINIFTYASQSFGSGGSEDAGLTGDTVEIGPSWSKYTQTFVIPSVFGKTIGANNFTYFGFFMPLNTTFTFDLASVQLNYGSVALPFVPKRISEEYNDSCRYAIEITPGILCQFTSIDANYIDFVFPVPEPLRATPTISNIVFFVFNTSGVITGFTFSSFSSVAGTAKIRASKTAHGLTSATLGVTTGGVLDSEL